MATVTLMPGFEVGRPSALSRHVRPRMDVNPPTANLPGPMTPMPTSSQSNKKTNNAIVYTRVVSDASRLSLDTGQEKASFAEGFLVFSRGRSIINTSPIVNALESNHSILSNVENVNAEIKRLLLGMQDDADIKMVLNAIGSWKLDGIFKGADLEIGSARANTNSAILVTIAGPTIVKNIFVARPQHGDMLYIGLIWKEDEISWKPFSSQDLVHLSQANTSAPHVPRTNPLWQRSKPYPYGGSTQSHPITYKKFTSDDASHMIVAYKIGKIVDSNHAPGEVRVNVQISPISTVELGLAYTPRFTSIAYDRQTYETRLVMNNGLIGGAFAQAKKRDGEYAETVCKSHQVHFPPWGQYGVFEEDDEGEGEEEQY